MLDSLFKTVIVEVSSQVSDADGYLERTFLSPASVRAANLIQMWMEGAGLRTWSFLSFIHCPVTLRVFLIFERVFLIYKRFFFVAYQVGWCHGKCSWQGWWKKCKFRGSSDWISFGTPLHQLFPGYQLSRSPWLKVLFQQDTVIDAGIFDGALGIISALSALKTLHHNGTLEKLRRPVEVSNWLIFNVKLFLQRMLDACAYIYLYICIQFVCKWLWFVSKSISFFVPKKPKEIALTFSQVHV